MKKSKNTKKRQKRTGLVPKMILLVFVIYASATLISNKVRADELRAENDRQDQLYADEEIRNTMIKEMLSQEETDEYMRKLAEEQGYVDPNTIIFEDVSGN